MSDSPVTQSKLTILDCPPPPRDPLFGEELLGYRWARIAERMGAEHFTVRLHRSTDRASLVKACYRHGLRPSARLVQEDVAPGEKPKTYYLVVCDGESSARAASGPRDMTTERWGTYGSLRSNVGRLLSGEGVIVPDENVMIKLATEMGVRLRTDHPAVYRTLGKTRRERRVKLTTEPAEGGGWLVKAPPALVEAVAKDSLKKKRSKKAKD